MSRKKKNPVEGAERIEGLRAEAWRVLVSASARMAKAGLQLTPVPPPFGISVRPRCITSPEEGRAVSQFTGRFWIVRPTARRQIALPAWSVEAGLITRTGETLLTRYRGPHQRPFYAIVADLRAELDRRHLHANGHR